jgi:FixJ family two-component response regulator
MQTIEDTNAFTRVLDLLDSNQSESEFERHKDKNRLLHLCKKHKFKNLEKAGMIEVSKKTAASLTKKERIEVGKKIIERLNQKCLIKQIAEEFGIHRDTVLSWADLAGWNKRRIYERKKEVTDVSE